MLTYLHTLCRDLPPEDEDAGLELMVVVKVGGRGGGTRETSRRSPDTRRWGAGVKVRRRAAAEAEVRGERCKLPGRRATRLRVTEEERSSVVRLRSGDTIWAST